MKKNLKKKMAIPIAVLMLNFASYSQANKQNNGYGVTQKQTKENGTISYLSFDLKHSAYSSGEHEKIFKDQLALKDGASFKNIGTSSDEQNFTHEKFQLSYQGIPVEFSTYNLHYKEGKLESMNGDLFNLDNLNISPSITKADGLQKAIQYSGASNFLWNNQADAALMNYTKPEGELVFVPIKENGKETLKLAYKYYIYATNPLVIADIYVDANTGEKLLINSRVCIHEEKNKLSIGSNNAPVNNNVAKTGGGNSVLVAGNAATKYSGIQQIETTKKTTNYILQDATRNIHTYSMKGSITSYSNALEITDNDNNWTAAEFHNATNDDAALDAHWGSAHFYDYFKNTHQRNSFDGIGGEIKNYAGADLPALGYGSNENAFWNGQSMVYGTGSDITSPLTSIQVVGHEIGHGFYNRALSGQNYNDAPGAINEGLSDIWGVCVTNHANMGKELWLMGYECGRVHRSFSDPKSTKLPDTYLMTNWARSNFDFGGVHTNSGIISHWFFILTQGKTGTNDLGNKYSVSGIGMDKAAKIVYKLETSYLTLNSNFEDFRTLAIKSAIDLYTDGSNEVIQVTNAFYAVGLGSAYNVNGSDTQKPSAPNLNSISASAITSTSINLSWAAATDNIGIKNYVINYEGKVIGSTMELERFNKTIAGNITNFTLTGLYPTFSYNISITALDSSGNAALSNIVSTTLPALTENVAPTAPVLTLDITGNNYCTFHWTASTDNTGIKEYLIYLDGTLTRSVSRSELISNLGSLKPSTKYTLEIEAIDFSGNSKKSNKITFTTHADADAQNPSNPILSFSNISSNSVQLNWTPSTDDGEVVGYYIYRGQTLLFYEDLLILNTAQYKFTATNLSPATKYDFKVVARDRTGKLSASPNFSSVTTLGDNIAPSAPLNLVGKSITNNSVKLTWGFSTDNTGIKEYKIYKNSTYLQTEKGNIANITGLNQGTTYTFYVTAVDNYNNTSLPSNTITINTTGNGSTVVTGYCPINGSSNVMYIDQVGSFATSGANGGYKDFTANTPLNATIGSIFNLNLKAGFTAFFYNVNWAVWIDYNKNNQFEATEKVITTTSINATVFSAAGSIPATATPVTTRMRIIMSYNTIADACTNIQYGEAEDYTIKLNVGNSTSAYCTITGNTLYEYIDKVGTFANSGNNGGYKDFSAVNNITGAKVGASFNLDLKPGFKSTPYNEYWGAWIDFNKNNIFESTERVLTTQTTNSNLFTSSISIPASASSGKTTMRIIMSETPISNACSAIQFGESEDYSITIDAATVTPPTSPYCAASGGTKDEFIDKVSIFSISGNNGGYKDFTSSVITGLKAGASFGLDLKAGFTGTSYKENWAVWIDYNQNKTFEATEKVISTTSNNASLFNATGTLPSNAMVGKTRMRVMMSYSVITNPCGTFTYGEVEDYTVDIQAASGGGTTPSTGYCAVKGNTVYEYINIVGSQNTGNNNGYLDNTGVKFNLPATGLTPINIAPGFNGNYSFTEYWSIWIDMNQNGSFDSNENVLSNYVTTGTIVNMPLIMLNATSKNGKTTMRIIMSETKIFTPCPSGIYGEVEDYSVEISGGSGIIIDPNNDPNNSTNKTTGINENNTVNAISVFPNPSADFIQLNKQFNTGASYQIMNALGELVKNGQIFESEKINIHELNSGIYFIQVKEGNAVYLGKIIKR